MGYEYEGHFAAPIAETAVRALFDSLVKDGRWRLVRRNEHELALAFAEEPHNPAWPESIVVQPSESRIYVLFHGYTGSQAQEFLDAVTRTLASLGARLRYRGALKSSKMSSIRHAGFAGW